jgi:hypothetical protein
MQQRGALGHLPAKASIALQARRLFSCNMPIWSRTRNVSRMSKCGASSSSPGAGNDDEETREELLQRVANMNLYDARAPDKVGSEYGEVRTISLPLWDTCIPSIDIPTGNTANLQS